MKFDQLTPERMDDLTFIFDSPTHTHSQQIINTTFEPHLKALMRFVAGHPEPEIKQEMSELSPEQWTEVLATYEEFLASMTSRVEPKRDRTEGVHSVETFRRNRDEKRRFPC